MTDDEPSARRNRRASADGCSAKTETETSRPIPDGGTGARRPSSDPDPRRDGPRSETDDGGGDVESGDACKANSGHRDEDGDSDGGPRSPTDRSSDDRPPRDDRSPSDDCARDSGPSDAARRDPNAANPTPWVSLDYGAFETDDRDLSLDENAPSLKAAVVGRTGFDPSDADGEHQKWERLRDFNNGVGESDRSSQLHRANLERELDIIADRLGATDHQRDRTLWLLDRIEIKAELLPNGPIEAAILGVVSVVIDEDRTRYARGGGNVTSVTRDDAFTELLAEYDLTRSRIHDVRGRLRETSVYESPNG